MTNQPKPTCLCKNDGFTTPISEICPIHGKNLAKPIPCVWCKETFSNKISLANHFDNVHKVNQPKPKECKKANCSFTGAHSHAVPKNYYPESEWTLYLDGVEGMSYGFNKFTQGWLDTQETKIEQKDGRFKLWVRPKATEVGAKPTDDSYKTPFKEIKSSRAKTTAKEKLSAYSPLNDTPNQDNNFEQAKLLLALIKTKAPTDEELKLVDSFLRTSLEEAVRLGKVEVLVEVLEIIGKNHTAKSTPVSYQYRNHVKDIIRRGINEMLEKLGGKPKAKLDDVFIHGATLTKDQGEKS